MTEPAVAVLPAAVTALRDVIRGALPEVTAENPDGVEVYDGPDPARPLGLDPRAITVASAFEENQSAIETQRVYTGAARNYTDTLTVACSGYVGGGEESVEDYRAEMGAILAAIAEAIDDDPTLGDAVSRARLTSATWLQGLDEAGAGVIVGFLVELVILS